MTMAQEIMLTGWLWILTGVWNWAIRKIELDAKDGIYHTEIELRNSCAGSSKRLGIPSHVVQAMICQAHMAWDRCFKKLGRKPSGLP